MKALAMTARMSLVPLACSLLLLTGLSGCSTVSKLNPFQGKAGHGKSAKGIKTDDKRISIIAFDPKVSAATALKGQDFYLPPPAPLAAWPLPGGTPEQSVEHVEAGAGFKIVWRKGFGRGSSASTHVMAPPVMADGRLYVLDGEAEVSAINAKSGQTIWHRSIRPKSKRDRQGFGGGLAYADGKLYAASGFRVVTQLDAATGKPGWTTDTTTPIHAAPTIADGRVFVVSTDNELLSFDAKTGAPGWDYQALVEPARILAASSPAVSGDVVIAAFASGELVAFRTANGNELWNDVLARSSRNNALSEIRDVAGRPVVYKGAVFAASHSGVFSATDLRTGEANWTIPVASTGTPWPVGDVVYVISTAGEVICASRENGQVYWIRDLNAGLIKKKRSLWTGPFLASGHLVVASDKGQVLALDPKTGVTQRTLSVGEPVTISPIAVGGTIYLVTSKAQLIAIR